MRRVVSSGLVLWEGVCRIMLIAPHSNRRGRMVFGKPTAFVIPTGTFSGVSIIFLIFCLFILSLFVALFFLYYV